jgi:uncharacterized membrane protein HdeD (DUF308 family)
MKLYTGGWIIWGSFVGGPFAGCYFLSKNYQALGDKKRAKTFLWIGILVTVFLGILIGIIPDSIMDKTPSSVIPFIYIAFIYAHFIQNQSKQIIEKLQGGAQKQSGWKVTGIGLLSLILSFILMFLIGFPLHSLIY